MFPGSIESIPDYSVPAEFPISATAQLPYPLISAGGPVANASLPVPSFAHPTSPHPAQLHGKTIPYVCFQPTGP